MHEQVTHAGRTRFLSGLYVLCSLFASFAAGASAQHTPGLHHLAFSGHVTDSTGALIPGAHVELRLPAGSIVLSTITDSSGHYAFVNADPGVYVVAAGALGFASFQSDPLTLASGKSPTLDIRLAIAEALQQVEVSSDAGSPTSNGGAAFILKGRALDDLPLDPGQLTQELNALAGSNTPELRINGFSGGTMPPRDSIREIRINQNPYSAQNDVNPVDGVVEILTRPGGGEFHGIFHLYGEDSAFNSLSPFVEQAPPYHSIGSYGNLGGPLAKRASFFTTANHSGDNANSVINAQSIDLATLQPTSISEAVSSPSSSNGFGARIDSSIGKKNTLTFNYTWNQNHQNNAGIGNLSLVDQGFTNALASQVLQISNSRIFSTKIVNDTRFQYIRTRASQVPNSTAPAVIVQGAFNDGGSNTGNYRDNQDQYELQNYVSVALGKHFFDFGGRLRVARDANRSNANYNGEYIFSTLDDYEGALRNCPAASCKTTGASQYTQTVGDPSIVVTLADAGLFFQDDWKATPNLTLSAGLRYEVQNHISDHADWAPRLGFAWEFGAVKGKPQYTLTGGAGIFYKRFASANILQAQRQNGVTQTEYVVSSPGFFSNPATTPNQSELGAHAPSATFQISPNFRAPYYLSSTVALQRSVGRYGSITATYLFNRGVHSLLTRNINAPLPGTYDPNNPDSGTRPLGGDQNIYQYESAGVYNSNRFTTNYFLRLKSRFLLYGLYMLRSDKTDTNGGFPSNQYDIGADYGRSSDDSRQSISFGGNATLPWKIQIATFVITNSALPFNIVIGQDLNGDSQFNERPSFATDLSRPSVVKTKYGNFDTSPIAGQTIIPNNYGNGFDQLTVNLSFRKGFDFGPQLKSRAELPKSPTSKPAPVARKYNVSFYLIAANALNTANLAPPVGILNSPLFGKSVALFGATTTSANRILTLDMAFRF